MLCEYSRRRIPVSVGAVGHNLGLSTVPQREWMSIEVSADTTNQNGEGSVPPSFHLYTRVKAPRILALQARVPDFLDNSRRDPVESLAL